MPFSPRRFSTPPQKNKIDRYFKKVKKDDDDTETVKMVDQAIQTLDSWQGAEVEEEEKKGESITMKDVESDTTIAETSTPILQTNVKETDKGKEKEKEEKRHDTVTDDNDDGDNDVTTTAKRRTSSHTYIIDPNDEEEQNDNDNNDDNENNYIITTTKRRRSSRIIDSNDEEEQIDNDDNEDNDTITTAKRRRSSRIIDSNDEEEQNDNDDNEDNDTITTAKRRRSSRIIDSNDEEEQSDKKLKKVKTRARVNNKAHTTTDAMDVITVDNTEMAPKRRSSRIKNQIQKNNILTVKEKDSGDEADDLKRRIKILYLNDTDDSDMDRILSSSSKNARPRRRISSSRTFHKPSDSDYDITDHFIDDEDEEEQKTHRKQSKRRSQEIKEDPNEIMEEANDLDRSAIISGRTRTPKESKFKKNLRLHKMKDNSNTSNIEQPLAVNSDDSNKDDEFEIDEIEEVTNSSDNFIAENESGHVELPDEFKSRKKSYYFHVFIQYLVHLSFDQNENFVAEAKRNDYFGKALEDIDRKIQTYRDNLVVSQAWDKNFKKNLERFPEITLKDIPPRDGCDACHRKRRIATISVEFSGTPYHSETFCAKSGEDSEESDYSDNDFPSVDDQSPQISYRVGRFCADRSELWHNLNHQKFHIFQEVKMYVNNYLEGLEGLEPSNVNPDDIYEWMNEQGKVGELWKQMKSAFEEAENYSNDKNNYYKKVRPFFSQQFL